MELRGGSVEFRGGLHGGSWSSMELRGGLHGVPDNVGRRTYGDNITKKGITLIVVTTMKETYKHYSCPLPPKPGFGV